MLEQIMEAAKQAGEIMLGAENEDKKGRLR